MRRLRSKQYGVPSEILWSKRPYLFPSRNPRENNWATWQRLAGRLTPVVRFCSSSPSTAHATGPETRSSPHTAYADTLCTTTCRPFPARRCRCALALTPPPAQVHRAEKPMAPSPLLVRPLALANSPLPPPRCVAAVAAAPAVRTAPAAPFSRLVITWRMRSSFSAKFRGDMVSLDRAGSVPSVGSPHRMWEKTTLPLR